MKVYRHIDTFEKFGKAVVTTGTFDGVHLGHKSLINQLNHLANHCGGESVILTFDPHPRLVLYPEDNDLKLINTIDEKVSLLAEAGVQHLIIHPFTKDFSRLSSLQFIRDILVNKLGTHKLVIGYNHHFGRNREGGFEHLKEYGPVYGFEVEEIPAKDVDSIEVSSTKIRNALLSGEIRKANELLGRHFSFAGEVIHGKKLGRTLGVPTANLFIADNLKILPSNGIYAVFTEVDSIRYASVLSIGTNPTVGGTRRSIEVHLFDFNQDVYGKELRVFVHEKIREEQTFASLEQLTWAMKQDIEQAKSLLQHLAP